MIENFLPTYYACLIYEWVDDEKTESFRDLKFFAHSDNLINIINNLKNKEMIAFAMEDGEIYLGYVIFNMKTNKVEERREYS